MKITKSERARIISLIDRGTDYDPATVRFHRDGYISAKICSNKVPGNGQRPRLLAAWLSDFEHGADPYNFHKFQD